MIERKSNEHIPLPQILWGTTNVAFFKFAVVVGKIAADYLFTVRPDYYFVIGSIEQDVCKVVPLKKIIVEQDAVEYIFLY